MKIIENTIFEITKDIHPQLSTGICIDILPDGELVSDYAKRKGINTIIKGIRNIQDTEYERMLHEITVAQENGIDTCVLFSNPIDVKVSSSAVKELIKYNADVRDYVSIYTKQQLEIKQGQYIIGVTGTIGVGKSYITKLLSDIFTDRNYDIIHIDMDKIAHELTYSNEYTWQNNVEIMELRSKIQYMLMGSDADQFPNIVKEKLAERIFNDKNFNRQVQDLYKPVMIREIRRRIAGKKGIIILNGALLIDCDMMYLCNNNVIVVDVPNIWELEHRLYKRYNSIEELTKRLNSQLNSGSKLVKLRETIEHDNNGKYIRLDNEKGEPIYDAVTEEEKQNILIGILRDSKFISNLGLFC